MDIDAVVTNLCRRRFLAKRFDSNTELKRSLLEIIGSQSVGISGSASVNELGVFEALTANGNNVLSHNHAKDKEQTRLAALSADVYLCSANAITEQGVILNIDGTGNRVAGTIFGPKTVIIIAGINKIVPDVERGILRTRQICCPQNAKRHGFATPCAIIDECANCVTPDRMCNVFVLLEYPTRHVDKFYVFLSCEELGW